MLDKFSKEHTHTEDEIRFILQGSGVFHINPGDRPVFGIEVHAGDLISVPMGTRHWFDLCGDRRIRAIRLFQDTTGWTPHYVADAVHAGYEPLCLGPSMLPGQGSGRAGS
jgi:1,2-dihydroxy-3-keto-5-methylthiopentene dioxygenase